MKINKFLPFAFLYFFFNSLWLPLGLLYTAILTPVFYLWIILEKQKLIIIKFLVVIFPFFVIHIINGVSIIDYLKSLILLFTSYIFCYAFFLFLNRSRALDRLFKLLIISNILLTIIAVAAFFTNYKELFWSVTNLSGSIQNFPRLRLFTYEPSYYSTLLVPLVLYFFLKSFYGRNNPQDHLFLILGLLSLGMSFSLGVIGGMAISFFIFFVFFISRVKNKKRHFYKLIILLALVLVVLFCLLFLFEENPLIQRLQDIVKGTDTSAKGRTFEAFILAFKIAKEKSLLFGVGLGQIKVIGQDIIIDFYNYPSTTSSVSVPNAVAETLAIFGIIGVILRILLEIMLFFITRVYRNPYRMMLFTFIFIYQFTGSFIVNIAEYVIWIIAFSDVFKEFNWNNLNTLSNKERISNL